MNPTLLILLVLSGSTAGVPPVKPPASIEIHSNDYFRGWRIEPDGSSARIELELGDTVESAVVEVVPWHGEDRPIVVEVQVETSLTIMDQGPHLDLVDWKHHRSDWIELERIGPGRFRVPKLESDPELNSRFPRYTADELYAAALAAGGRRWADLAREWPDPADGRVGVAVSTVRLRVVAREAGASTTLFTLQIGVPMGC